MQGRVQGKVAVVTGGASGIGRATALAFAREGAKNEETMRKPIFLIARATDEERYAIRQD